MYDTVNDRYIHWKMLFEKLPQDHIQERKMRIREQDISYIEKSNKNEEKICSKYSKHRTPENWELKRVWRNIATNERRKAIKAYWKKKADDLKTKPKEFYKTFGPFLNKKEKGEDNINININGRIEMDQAKVA